MKEPVYTQTMTLHLNRGSVHDSHYKILCDGLDTGITKHVRHSMKDGTIAAELHAGPETFDIKATKGQGMMYWIRTHQRLAGVG